MRKFLTKIFKKYLKIQQQSNERSLENTNQDSLKIVLDQFSRQPKPIGIQDLQNEISQIKFQINNMLIQNQDLETRLKALVLGENSNFGKFRI